VVPGSPHGRNVATEGHGGASPVDARLDTAWQVARTENGNVALGGEVDLLAGGSFLPAPGFGEAAGSGRATWSRRVPRRSPPAPSDRPPPPIRHGT
jgi:hypothetical protein